MSDLTPSFVRTLVPLVIGPLAARYAPGIDTSDPDVLLALSAVIGWAYYVLVRLIETRFPRLGYLLGIAKTPAYSPAPPPSPGPGEDVEAVLVPDEGHSELDTVLLVTVVLLVVLVLLGVRIG